MSVRETFAEGALTLEQWQHVEALSQTLNPAQARWISGYFAGLDAGMLRAGGASLPARADGRTLTVLYGTETGNSTQLARALEAAARERGLAPELVDMANYKPRKLKDEQDLLIVVSTYGEGDPPQPAIGFFEFVEGSRAPRLEAVRFAVLALGDSTYEKYCEAGKRLDRRLEELGATRLRDRVDCDIDYDEPAAVWQAAVLDLVGAPARGTAASAMPALPSQGVHDKRNPFAATIVENTVIVGRGSSKETRHIEIDLAASGLTYEPGDSLGISVRNEDSTVAAVLEAGGFSAEAPLEVKGQDLTLREALERHFEITLSTPRFISHWGMLTGSAELERLGLDENSGERAAYLHSHHVVDVMRRYPLAGVAPETFVAGLRPLQPRLYSIASSLSAAPEEAHLTLSPVRYTLHDERRSGVASAHLSERGGPGTVLPVYVQSNPHFRLPSDDVPIVMVGAGTGVAPYRAFMQEREARGGAGRSWLFFGERNFRSDFLYQGEWQDLLKQGVLTRMDVAFSRDKAGRAYVQHRMLEQARNLYAWLSDGAHFYVCGDAAAMAPDVHEALIAIVEQQAGIGREAAEDYVRGMQRDHRYQRDVY